MAEPEHVFTLGALGLIRELAERGANVNRIRAALFKQEGVWFRDAPILAAGKLLGVEIQPREDEGPYRALDLLEHTRPIERVRRVPPGTFPARRFSMLGGRLR